MCQKRCFYLLFLIILCLFAIGCTETVATPVSEPVEVVVEPTEEATDMPTVTATTLPTITPSATPTPLPSPTATLTLTEMPTLTPTPAPTCPKPGTAVSFPTPANTTELQSSILEYLNAGGQWEDLFALLDELEIEHDWIEADMNGDGVMETAVYTLLFNEEEYIPEHSWWIFQCTSNQYNISHKIGGTWAFHSHFIVDDLNNDARADVVIVKGFAGSACDLEPTVWLWKVDQIVDYSPSYKELQLGCSFDQRVLLREMTDDNIKELILIGSTVAHLDMAPPRGITQTFSLEDAGYKLVSTEFAPADLRIYALDDAQKALDDNDLDLAISLYNQAAYEDISTVGASLLRPTDFYFQGEAYQRVFALFRLAVIYRVIGNVSESDAIMVDLNDRYLENQPGYEFVVLTQTFMDAYEESEQLNMACKQVREYIEENYNDRDGDLPVLTTHFYWGWNIAYYDTPDSFCPLFRIN